MLIRGVVSSPVRGVVGSGFGGGDTFSLDAYMASQSDGFWFDLTRSDTMFQEDVGPTPADDPNEVIGLALSQRLWGGQTRTAYLAGQAELVTPGSWTLVAQPSASATESPAGTLNLVGNGTAESARAYQSAATVAGRVYRVRATIVVGSGVALFRIGPSAGSGTIYTSSPPSSVDVYVVATGAATFIDFAKAGDTATISNISVKEVTRYPATQATTGFKPKFQPTGGEGDAIDDRLRTGYACGSGDNWLILPNVTVPASLSATQIMSGAMDGSSNGFYAAITTAGEFRVKVGQTTIDSTGLDLRNGVHDLGMWIVDSTAYLFVNGEIVGSGAWTGSRPATTWNLFSLNNNGTSAAHFGGRLAAALAGRDAMTLSRAIQITNAIS